MTEQSPFGNGDPFLYGDPHIEMGIRSICFPIWKQGFTLSIWGCFYLCFHMVIAIWKRGAVSLSSLYGNGDSHMEMGISKGCANPRFHMVIAIWKWGAVSFSSLYGNGDPHMEMGISKGCANPRFHMVIAIWKRGSVSFSSLYGNGDPHMKMGISKGCANPRFHMVSPYGNGEPLHSAPYMETGIPI